jgi:NitT/TauT family transport system substrate-binding protein
MKLLTTMALLAAMTVGSGGANAACDRMEKVSAVWLPIMQTTAYYVALEEKFFLMVCKEIFSLMV